MEHFEPPPRSAPAHVFASFCFFYVSCLLFLLKLHDTLSNIINVVVIIFSMREVSQFFEKLFNSALMWCCFFLDRMCFYSCLCVTEHVVQILCSATTN